MFAVSPGSRLSAIRFGPQVDSLQPETLTPVGPALFQATGDSGNLPADSKVLQGFLESSNVQPAGAMVEMIQSARYFEAAQRALRAIAETVQLNTRPSA